MSQDVRSFLFAGYTLVRSIETNKSLAAVTFDHIIQDYITSIKSGETRDIIDGRGSSTRQRSSRYDQLNALLTNFNTAIQAIQDAGDDKEKLRALGVLEVDSPTVAEDQQSSNAGNNAS